MARASLKVSKLEFVKRITLIDTLNVRKSLCALSDDEVLLAYAQLGVRAILLNSSQIYQHEVVAFKDVRGMAFDALTDTLLLLVSDQWQLVSLRRNASKWIEVQRLPNVLNEEDDAFALIAVCDSQVLIGKSKSRGNCTLHVYNVSADHNVSAAGSVVMSRALASVTTRMSHSHITISQKRLCIGLYGRRHRVTRLTTCLRALLSTTLARHCFMET